MVFAIFAAPQISAAAAGSGLRLPDANSEEQFVLFTGEPTTQPAPTTPPPLSRANTAFGRINETGIGADVRADRIRAAVDLYRAFIATPDGASALHRSEAQFYLGQCHLLAGRRDDATRCFSDLIGNRDFAASPFVLDAHYALGVMNLESGTATVAVTNFQACLTRLETHPATPEQAEIVRWLRPYLAQSQMRAGNFQEASTMFQAILSSTTPPPAAVMDFARRGLALVAENAARAAMAETNVTASDRLWGQALAALEVLRTNHATSPISVAALRTVAGIAYDHANATPAGNANYGPRFERSRTLFTQVHELGPTSPHRGDAVWFLGWTEYRLGTNFSAAAAYFGAVPAAPAPRHALAQQLVHVCRAQESYRLASAAASAPVQNATTRADTITHFRAVITGVQDNLASVTNPGLLALYRDLAARAGGVVLPRLETAGELAAFAQVHESLGTILGTGYRTTITGLFGRTVAARISGNWTEMQTAAEALLAATSPTNAASRDTWLFAKIQIGIAQLGLGQWAAAVTTFAAANTALTNWPEAERSGLRVAMLTRLIEQGERLLGTANPPAALLDALRQCFTHVAGLPATERGSPLGARAAFGLARTYELLSQFGPEAARPGRRTQAINAFEALISDDYPAATFPGEPYTQLRTDAAAAAERLRRP